MSLSVAGVWAVDVWDQTVWADGVWREGAPAVVDSVTTGGGKKRRRSKYPRRVMIDGVLHTVRNAEEERRLLQAIVERSQDAAKTAQALGDEQLAKQSSKSAVRISKRVAKVDSREDEWIRRLYEEDEELLLLIG